MATDYSQRLTTNPITQGNENTKVNTGLKPMPYPYVTGMQLAADIKLGTLTLNTIDANGVVWVCTDIQGWWSHPEPQMPELTRGWGDGSYDARGRWNARDITLTGVFLTQDPSQVEVARKTLIEATNLVYDGAYLVVNETTPKTSYVRLNGRPEIATTTARGRTEFSIGLRAADPIKYEYVAANNGYNVATLTPSANVTITNNGNTKVPVVFELGGTITTGSITSTNSASVVQTIGSITKNYTGTLEIDTLNRDVIKVIGTTVDVGRSYVGTLIDWIYLDPGVNTLKFTATGTSPTCTLYYRSGWIG